MDRSSLRWRYYLVSTVIVVLVLLAYQSWQSTPDWGFLAGVGVVYLVLSIVIDLARASLD